MKNKFKSTFAIITFLLGFTATAQINPTYNSLLWEISGNGLAKPSYLFGTLHMMCEKDFNISDKTKKAFEKSQKLVLELDLDDPSELAEMQKMVQSEMPLSKTLTPTEYQQLDDFLKKQVGVGAASFENYNLVSILSIAIIKALNCPPKMFEVEFSQMAASKQMEILGLENIHEQLSAFDQSFTNAKLIEQLQYYDASYLEQMVKVYNSENLNDLYAMVSDTKFMDANARKVMIDSRNENWVKQMPKLMKMQNTFFAVGAAHLPGNKGLIGLLKKAGYNVKPVMD